MAHKHISPTGKLAGHKISAEGNVDRFCRNVFVMDDEFLPVGQTTNCGFCIEVTEL